MTLVVLGDLMVDVVTRLSGPLARGSDTPARVSVEGGGSAANVAAWAASLGTPVALVCRVGDDHRGQRAVAQLREAGVEVQATVDPSRPTGTCVVLVEPGGERTMLPDPGANDGPLGPLPAGRHLHVAGYALLRGGPRATALAAIADARAAGMTVSVDPSSWALLYPGAIPEVDLLLPNEQEAGLVGAAPEVVTKLGPGGARWSDGSVTITVPAEPVEVSTPPAPATRSPPATSRPGSTGPDPRAALEAGCRVAARAVAQVGARPSYD